MIHESIKSVYLLDLGLYLGHITNSCSTLFCEYLSEVEITGATKLGSAIQHTFDEHDLY